MSLLLGVRNTTTQSVPALGTIDLGSVYRRYCKKNQCGVRTFDTTATSVSLQQQGIYHVTATLVGTGTTAGVVTIQLLENGVAVPSAFSSETITTPATELRTFVIDAYVLVDDACLLGRSTTLIDTLSLQNTGVAATFTAVTFNVEKVV
jgi:hypothetical protein